MADPSSGTPAAIVTEPRKQTDWWAEAKGIFWLLLAVLAFHSFVAKPFYIPSPSMMPTLITGDRLVVTKYPYGWSFVSPSFHVLPPMRGRLLGNLPERGDVVIVTPRGQTSDYIKRVIGLPGDRLEMRSGTVYINGVALKRVAAPPALIPIDPNAPCDRGFQAEHRATAPGGRAVCALPIVRETLPNGRSYDTVDFGLTRVDDFAELIVPPDHVFLMGDNRDESADSRVAAAEGGLDGPVPWENLGGRAEFITFSLDGSSVLWNPLTWLSAFRGDGRAGTSLHAERTAPQAPAR